MPPAATTGRGATASTTRGTNASVANLARQMTARLDSLRDNDIDARGCRALSLRYGPNLMEDFHASGVGSRDIGRRIAPE